MPELICKDNSLQRRSEKLHRVKFKHSCNYGLLCHFVYKRFVLAAKRASSEVDDSRCVVPVSFALTLLIQLGTELFQTT